MPLISKKFLINSAYLETKSVIIFELKLLKSSSYFLVKMFIYALFYLDLLTSQYIPLSVMLYFLKGKKMFGTNILTCLIILVGYSGLESMHEKKYLVLNGLLT